MSLPDEVERRRLAQIERRLNEVGSSVKGNQAFQADRIADVMEQIDEVRKQVEGLRSDVRQLVERVARHAEFLNQLKQERKNVVDRDDGK